MAVVWFSVISIGFFLSGSLLMNRLKELDYMLYLQSRCRIIGWIMLSTTIGFVRVGVVLLVFSQSDEIAAYYLKN